MKWMQSCLHFVGHHEAGAKLFITVGVTMKQVQSCLYSGGNHEAGAKLFTLWGSP